MRAAHISDLPDGVLEKILARTCWPRSDWACAVAFLRLQPDLGVPESPLADLFCRHFGVPGSALHSVGPAPRQHPMSFPALGVCKQWRQLLLDRPRIRKMALVAPRRAVRIPQSVTTLFVCVPPSSRDDKGIDALLAILLGAPQLETLVVSCSESPSPQPCCYSSGQFLVLREALARMTRLRRLHYDSGITLDTDATRGVVARAPLPGLPTSLESFSNTSTSALVCQQQDLLALTALADLHLYHVPWMPGSSACGAYAETTYASQRRVGRSEWGMWVDVCEWAWDLLNTATLLTRLLLDPDPAHVFYFVPSELLDEFAPLAHLEQLSFACLDAEDEPELVERTTALTSLTQLQCRQVFAYPDVAPLLFIQGLPSLRHLTLELVDLEASDDAWLSPVSALTALTHLALSMRDCRGPGPQGPGMAHIAAGSGACLRVLALPDHSLIPCDLARNFPRLEVLQASHAYVESGALRGTALHLLVDSLTAPRGLCSLRLGVYGLHDAGSSKIRAFVSVDAVTLTLADLPALQELSVEFQGESVTVELYDLPELRTLAVRANTTRLMLVTTADIQTQLQDITIADEACRNDPSVGELECGADATAPWALAGLRLLHNSLLGAAAHGRHLETEEHAISAFPASLTRLHLHHSLPTGAVGFLPCLALQDLDLDVMRCNTDFLVATLSTLTALTRLRAPVPVSESARRFCTALRSNMLRRLEIVDFGVQHDFEDFGLLSFVSALGRLTALELHGRHLNDRYLTRLSTFYVADGGNAHALLASTAALQAVRFVWLGRITCKKQDDLHLLQAGMPNGIADLQIARRCNHVEFYL